MARQSEERGRRQKLPWSVPESASEGSGTGYGLEKANGSVVTRSRILGPSGREMR